MEIPKTKKEAIGLVRDILDQGDSRYNSTHDETVLAEYLFLKAISLREQEIPLLMEPKSEDKPHTRLRVQKDEKLIARELLKLGGFQDSEILFEVGFLGSKPDVLAESDSRIIVVECCSCRVNKIIDFLQRIDEVWVLTRGTLPWEKEASSGSKMQWFIFKKGPKWDRVHSSYQQNLINRLKKIKSPIESI